MRAFDFACLPLGDILIHSQEFCGGGFIPRLVSNGAVAAPGQGGISIYDVTNPLMPRALKQNFLPFQVHNTFIYQQGNKAFVVVVDDENERDVHIVDITNPNAPKEVAVTGQPDFEAIEPIDNIGVNEVFLHDVTVQQNNGRVIALGYAKEGANLVAVDEDAAKAESIAQQARDLGRRAIALGREATASGRGMFLGNPHQPWHGSFRFTLSARFRTRTGAPKRKAS